MTRSAIVPSGRPEILREPIATEAFGIVQKPLSTWEKVTNVGAVRKLALLVLLAVIWEVYARWLNNPLMFPSFSDMAAALWDSTVNGPLIDRTLTSIEVLLLGYAAGIALAAIFIALGTQVESARLASIVLAGGAGALYLSQSSFWSVTAVKEREPSLSVAPAPSRGSRNVTVAPAMGL